MYRSVSDKDDDRSEKCGENTFWMNPLWEKKNLRTKF